MEKRIFLLFGATASMLGAVVLFMVIGLPERAHYTGYVDDAGQRVAPEVDAIAPPIAGVLLDGKPFDLVDLQGSPVVINFWATWCVPCRVEMPFFQEVFEQYQDAGLRIVAVNQGESADTVQTWVDEQGLTFDVVLDEASVSGVTYWLRGLPATFVLSSEGLILYQHYGTLTAEQLQSVLPLE